MQQTRAAEEKSLKVEQMLLSPSEDGPPFPSDSRFVPGEVVFFSCHVSGFARQGEEPPKMYLSFLIGVKDANGIPIEAPEAGKVSEALSPQDKEWRPKIRHTVTIPPFAASGRYVLTVQVRDELAKTETVGSVSLEVVGKKVEPSATLVARNFRFLRSEEDGAALKIAAYAQGDTVWARFDMTGYKLGEKNEYDVEYGLKVLRPGGDVTFERAQAAQEKNETFYPQRYTPGILSLTIPKDMQKGEYTIVLSIRDNLGKQSYETREKFSVE